MPTGQRHCISRKRLLLQRHPRKTHPVRCRLVLGFGLDGRPVWVWSGLSCLSVLPLLQDASVTLFRNLAREGPRLSQMLRRFCARQLLASTVSVRSVSCWHVFFRHKGDFFEGGWLSSNGEMLFVFFFLALWLADTPSVSRSSPFSILFARRFAVWNKFSGANFHFRLFVVALCVSVVFCLGFSIRMWCVAPETVLRKISLCQVSFS